MLKWWRALYCPLYCIFHCFCTVQYSVYCWYTPLCWQYPCYCQYICYSNKRRGLCALLVYFSLASASCNTRVASDQFKSISHTLLINHQYSLHVAIPFILPILQSLGAIPPKKIVHHAPRSLDIKCQIQYHWGLKGFFFINELYNFLTNCHMMQLLSFNRL